MTVRTSRTNENARIIIDYSKCKASGLCAVACKDVGLSIKNGKLTINENPVLGCLGCGQCAAICPNEAIHIEGRTLSKSDFIKMPAKENMPGYEQLNSLMLGRRSVRDFKPKEVEDNLIDKIINSASTAPMGIPPSDVKVLVLKGKAKVREFSFDFLDYVKSMRWFFSPVMLMLMRPFIGRDNYEAFRTFIKPLLDTLIEKREKGEDWLLYDAPLAMYFYSAQFADPADPYIAATYAMLVAESLGLGSCMIGSVAPFLKKGGTKLKKKYGLNPKSNDGIVVIFGYPNVKYHRAIKRTFAGIITH
ncbi:MAG: nitroreductase family protein [Planctomycetota bacterium]